MALSRRPLLRVSRRTTKDRHCNSALCKASTSSSVASSVELQKRIVAAAESSKRKGSLSWLPFVTPSFVTPSASSLSAGTKVAQFGGYAAAERKRIVVGPEILWPPNEEEGITSILVEKDSRWEKLEHRAVLGAVMALGLERNVIGDVRITKGGGAALICVGAEMAEYVSRGIAEVGKIKVETRVLDGRAEVEEILLSSEDGGEGKERRITVASMRADAILAAAMGTSRSKAGDCFKEKRVQKNWEAVKLSAHIKEGDVLSVKGFGRVNIVKEQGTTKKGKHSLTVEILS